MAIHVKVDHYHHDVCHRHDEKQFGYFKRLSIFDGKQLLLNLKGKLSIMALSMTDTQQASGTLAFVDKHGHTTDVPDGNVTVSSSDDSVATASYDDASNTITVVAKAPGVAALSIVAKNAKGEILPFEDVAVEIKSGDAVGGTITFGEATELPE